MVELQFILQTHCHTAARLASMQTSGSHTTYNHAEYSHAIYMHFSNVERLVFIFGGYSHKAIIPTYNEEPYNLQPYSHTLALFTHAACRHARIMQT